MRTYAILSDLGDPDHIHVLDTYQKLPSVRMAYPRMRQIYGPGGKPGSRCWVASLTISVTRDQDIVRGNVEFDIIHNAPILKSLNGDIMDQRPDSKESR
jgi:hypothetical protein